MMRAIIIWNVFCIYLFIIISYYCDIFVAITIDWTDGVLISYTN